LGDDLLAAFALLTRLPVGRLGSGSMDLARTVWAFPVVGGAVGALGAVAYWIAHRLGLPPFLGASWTLAAMLLITGAFHEDGLADVADGFGGGSTVERKLEIMRDSRIGAYGALALMLSLAIRIAALTALARPGAVFSALVAAGAMSRAGIVLTLLRLRPARSDGIAATLADIPRAAAWWGFGFAVLAALLCLGLGQTLMVLAVSAAACLAVSAIARAQIGGHTGDVLGAVAVIVECAALSAIAAMTT
jgi:adenosylcobinamide-GDP ribazoletransferase